MRFSPIQPSEPVTRPSSAPARSATPAFQSATQEAVRKEPVNFSPAGDSLVQKLGLMFLLVFLFVGYSRVLDFVFTSLHLPLILSLVSLIFAALAGGLLRPFQVPFGYLMSAFLIWMSICIPFGHWRGGSVLVLQDYFKVFVLFFLIVALLRRSRHVELALYAIALAVLAVAGMAFSIGVTDMDGRLILPRGLLANSNDMAQIILMGIPFWILFGWAGRPTSLSLRPLISVGVILFLMGIVMRTGSRLALIGLLAISVMLFLAVSLMGKLKLIALAVAGIIALFVFVPGQLQQRYATLFSSEIRSSNETVASAVASTNQRLELLRRTLLLTAEHPIFEAGAGEFQAVSARTGTKSGGGACLETHNTFTQVSSENGIPGFVIFLALQVVTFRFLWRLSRLQIDESQLPADALVLKRRLENVSKALLLSFISLNTMALFSSIAYHMFFPTVFALCAALMLSSRDDLELLRRAAEPSAKQSTVKSEESEPEAVRARSAVYQRRRPSPLKPRV